jgi:hypothetical protein
MEKCQKHKKYTGKRKPKHECVDCLSWYFLMKNKPRILPKPTKVIISKKYRQEKHKKDYQKEE